MEAQRQPVAERRGAEGHDGSTSRTLTPFGRLLGFMVPHKKLYILSIAESVLGVACGFLPYVAVANMALGLVYGNEDMAFFLLWCALAAGGFLAKAVLMGLSTTTSHEATFAVLAEARRALAFKLTRTPMGFVLDRMSGKLKTTIVERVEQMEVPLAHVIPEMTANLLVPLGIAVFLFVLDWRMALVSLVTIPIGLLCYAVQMRDYATKYAEVVTAKNHMSATIVEYINGIKVIKAFNQSAASYEKFTEAVKRNSGLMLEWMRVSLPWTAIMLSVWPTVLVGVLPVGCFFFMDGSLDGATFITIMVMSLGIVGPLLAAIMFTDDIAKISTVMGQIGEVLDAQEMERPCGERPLSSVDIELEEVRFAYKEADVIGPLSLAIPQGHTLALVGPSGSGKSTIAKLIAGFWDVNAGSLSVGGVDVREIPAAQHASLIAYVSQDNFLFDDTIRNNIRIGNMQATDEEVEATAKASGCHDFIKGLEYGYETVVGKAGGHLSGGERQRIAIARAMMKDAPIIILDEATAYTDPENEVVVQDAVARLAAGKTLIVIAHRLSTITDADEIVVMDKGRVVACGTHEALLAACPLYRRMWDIHIDTRDTV